MEDKEETVDPVSRYECEVCGKVETLTDREAFEAGWDYPPFIGTWGIISPRTCGDCGIEKSAYWFILKRTAEDMENIPEQHVNTIKRILAEVGGPSDDAS